MRFKPYGARLSTTALKNYSLVANCVMKRVGGDFQCFSDLWKDDATRLKKLLEVIDRAVPEHNEISDDNLYSHCLYYFCSAQWAAEGLNLFDVTASLMAGLLLTEASDDTTFLKLPFCNFHVRVPSDFIPILVHDGENTEKRWVTRIMVSVFDHVNRDDGEKTTYFRCVGSDQSGQIPDVTFNIELKDFVSVAHTVKTLEEDFIEPKTIYADTGHLGLTEMEDSRTQQLVLLVVANLCSWLESVGGLKDKKPDNSPKNMSQMMDPTRIRQWIVGREVKLSSEIIQASKDRSSGFDPIKRTAGWHLSHRHTVRGHWRWQAIGHEWKDHKKIWIAPHWNGPKAGDVAAHVYKLTSGENP